MIEVRTLADRNLTSSFLLPLINLNQASFGVGNFHESYVNVEGTVLTIEVISPDYGPSLKGHEQYISESYNPEDGYSLMWFELPQEWQPDFLLFKEGKYSRFSTRAKRKIKLYGGADNPRLLALDRNPALRHAWEQELACPGQIPATSELLEIPSPRNYREYIAT